MERKVSRRRNPANAAGPERESERVRPATLTDVARHAGVVPMTASRAINGTGYVSEQVQKRVIEAAWKLNYRPNILREA